MFYETFERVRYEEKCHKIFLITANKEANKATNKADIS